MAYNGYFPTGYQGYYNPYQGFNQPMQAGQQMQNVPNVQQGQTVTGIPTTAPQPTPQNGNSGLIWVQGEAGAKSYLVAPNNTVMLMDSENEVFYLKSSDASGMPLPLRTFRYQEVSAQNGHRNEIANQQVIPPDLVTRAEFDALRAQVDGILNAPKVARADRKKKEVKDDGEPTV